MLERTCGYRGCTSPVAVYIDQYLGPPAVIGSHCEHHMCRVCKNAARQGKDYEMCADCARAERDNDNGRAA